MQRVRPVWLILGVAALLAVSLGSLLHTVLTWQTLAQHSTELHAWIARRPIAAGVAYFLLYASVVSLSLPAGGLLTVTGGLLFGAVAGAILAVLAASVGAVILFLLARGTLGGALANRARPLIERLREPLERDGFWALLALRLIPVVPFWLTNLAPALLGMRLLPYAVATVLGILPATVVLAGIGAGAGEVLTHGGTPDLSLLLSAPVLLPILGLAVLALLPVLWRRLRAVRPAT